VVAVILTDRGCAYWPIADERDCPPQAKLPEPVIRTRTNGPKPIIGTATAESLPAKADHGRRALQKPVSR
jgi:hypothetical protein